MAYTKIGWQNEDSPEFIKGESPAINAGNLQHMDEGIAGALQRSGGTMTGSLFLFKDPTSSKEAATKNYVDNNIIYLHLGGVSLPDGKEKVVDTIENFNSDEYIMVFLKQGTDGQFLTIGGFDEWIHPGWTRGACFRVSHDGVISVWYQDQYDNIAGFSGAHVLLIPCKHMSCGTV